MKKLVVVAIALSTLAFSRVAAAGPEGPAVQSVTAHTRDGGAWKPGQPVMLMFEVRGDGALLPQKGLAVVMEIDKEKTKCLDVPLRLLSTEGAAGTYAGIFYPFHEGDFDGKVVFADGTPQDFAFRVAAARTAASASTPLRHAWPSSRAPRWSRWLATRARPPFSARSNVTPSSSSTSSSRRPTCTCRRGSAAAYPSPPARRTPRSSSPAS